jgi:hypothetical protein
MVEFAAGNCQAVDDFPKALGLCKLAEEHGDKLVPAGESLAVTFGSGLLDKSGELYTRNDLEDLAE